MSFRSVLIAAVGGLGLLGGCADVDDRPAKFDYIVAAILRPGCATANCHDAMTRRQGLDFSTVAAAGATVDNEGLVPIGGGDPADTQLIFRLTTDGDGRYTHDQFERSVGYVRDSLHLRRHGHRSGGGLL